MKILGCISGVTKDKIRNEYVRSNLIRGQTKNKLTALSATDSEC